MSLFRGEGPALGEGAHLRLENGANAPTLAKLPAFLTVDINGISATSTTQSAFVAPLNSTSGSANLGVYGIVGVGVVFGTASSSGTLQVEVTPSGTAAGSGTNILTGTISLAGSANTPVYGTLAAPAGTAPNLIANGARVSLVFAGTMTSLANCVVTIYLQRV